MPEESVVMVCARADSPRVVPNSDFSRRCDRCQTRIMIAPSGQEFLKTYNKSPVSLVCSECWLNTRDVAILQASIQACAPAKQLAEEIAASIPNPHLRRN